MFSSDYYEIFKSSFFYSTPMVVAPDADNVRGINSINLKHLVLNYFELKIHVIIWVINFFLKGTVIPIKKALINNRLPASKVSWKFRILQIYNFS